MPEYRLNCLIRHAKAVKVRGKASPECMPAVPFNSRFRELGLDLPLEQRI